MSDATGGCYALFAGKKWREGPEGWGWQRPQKSRHGRGFRRLWVLVPVHGWGRLSIYNRSVNPGISFDDSSDAAQDRLLLNSASRAT